MHPIPTKGKLLTAHEFTKDMVVHYLTIISWVKGSVFLLLNFLSIGAATPEPEL